MTGPEQPDIEPRPPTDPTGADPVPVAGQPTTPDGSTVEDQPTVAEEARGTEEPAAAEETPPAGTVPEPAQDPDDAPSDRAPSDRAPSPMRVGEVRTIPEPRTDRTDDAHAGEPSRGQPPPATAVARDSRAAHSHGVRDRDARRPAGPGSVGEGLAWPHPDRTRIIAVANQKGGCAKTTSTVNLAAALAQAGLSVLVIDLDPQGNASTALGLPHHVGVPSLYDVIVDRRPLVDIVSECSDIPGLYAAPATIDLTGADVELITEVGRELRLRQALSAFLDDRNGTDRIDYVLIDCPPSLSLLTVNAFTAAAEVLIPVQCEYYALEGLSQLLGHVDLVRAHLNPDLHISSLLLTMYDSRTRLSAQVADEVRSHFPTQVAATVIPRSVRISEAPSHGQTVLTYDPSCSGAACYRDAARELAQQGAAQQGTTQHGAAQHAHKGVA